MSLPDDQKEEWRSRLRAAQEVPPPVVRAHTYANLKWDSASNPRALACDDGRIYVVKGVQVGRSNFNDQVVARLGIAMEAPVGEPMLVEVPGELVAQDAALPPILPGIGHGTAHVPECSERLWLENVSLPQNRERFARLALLYGWVTANDHQLIYRTEDPRMVYSVDHGHFFPSGPEWRSHHISPIPPASIDQNLMSGCALTTDELCDAVDLLKSVTDQMIVEAVAAPPASWGVQEDERLLLLEYLLVRREHIIAQLPQC